ncbi:MAG: hypothetical protein C5B48_03725 [Candidatus Rokuibacteriota bacterium]|nr:MAG: hypothetical protein C5B48_03725 [Candidatus Rokubacteria bacterium]
MEYERVQPELDRARVLFEGGQVIEAADVLHALKVRAEAAHDEELGSEIHDLAQQMQERQASSLWLPTFKRVLLFGLPPESVADPGLGVQLATAALMVYAALGMLCALVLALIALAFEPSWYWLLIPVLFLGSLLVGVGARRSRASPLIGGILVIVGGMLVGSLFTGASSYHPGGSGVYFPTAFLVIAWTPVVMGLAYVTMATWRRRACPAA